MSLLARLLVRLTRRLALLDHAEDGSPADLHLEAVDGCVFGQRKDVDPLEPLVRRVDERLADIAAGDDAADVDRHLGRNERREIQIAAIGPTKQKAAAARVIRALDGAQLRNAGLTRGLFPANAPANCARRKTNATSAAEPNRPISRLGDIAMKSGLIVPPPSE